MRQLDGEAGGDLVAAAFKAGVALLVGFRRRWLARLQPGQASALGPPTYSQHHHREAVVRASSRDSYFTCTTIAMKLITAALLSALSCYTELAAAATGHVLTFNPSTSPQDQTSNERRTLSPATARLVLAQRAGVEDYHVEKALSEEEIEAVNDFGYKTSLLGSHEHESERKFVLAFVDESEAEGTFP